MKTKVKLKLYRGSLLRENFVIVECEDKKLLEEIENFFKRRISNWKYIPIVRKGFWDGFVSFYQKGIRCFPIGLLFKFLKFLENKKISYEIEEDVFKKIKNLNFNLTFEEFSEIVYSILEGGNFGKGAQKEIRDYQLETAYKILKYNFSRAELVTSAGKSFIIFLVFLFLKYHLKIKNTLIIVPKVNLVYQMMDNFVEYFKEINIENFEKIFNVKLTISDSTLFEFDFKNNFSIKSSKNIKLGFTYKLLYGLEKDRSFEGVDLIISTYQTLNSIVKSNRESFLSIDSVIVDEAHHTVANSIKEIILECKNLKFRTGLSGTLKSDLSAEDFTLDAFLGPQIQKITFEDLSSKKQVTPVKIKIVYLDYISEDVRNDIQNVLKLSRDETNIQGIKRIDVFYLERNIVSESKKRLNFLTNLIKKFPKNSLVLFSSIENGFGNRLFESLKNVCANEKQVFYIDGKTSPSERETIKAKMELGDDKILIASFGTFSTGISINNIHYIVFAESYKSEKIIKQSIGRGMRLHANKEKLIVFDIVDDFSIVSKNGKRISKNILFKHSEEREKIYELEGYEIEKIRIKL